MHEYLRIASDCAFAAVCDPIDSLIQGPLGNKQVHNQRVVDVLAGVTHRTMGDRKFRFSEIGSSRI